MNEEIAKQHEGLDSALVSDKLDNQYEGLACCICNERNPAGYVANIIAEYPKGCNSFCKDLGGLHKGWPVSEKLKIDEQGRICENKAEKEEHKVPGPFCCVCGQRDSHRRKIKQITSTKKEC